jgi:dolichol-phosphate mannosyltransferase
MNYSIIIPILNEEKNIPLVIKKISNVFRYKKLNYEILFIDDESKDNSLATFNRFKKKHTKFFTRKEKPRDLSKSVIYGFDRSKFNNLVVMDGDLQHRPEDLLKLMKTYEQKKLDIVFGSRNLKKYTDVNLNFLRFLFSKLLNKIFNFLFSKSFDDPMSGFFIVKKKIYTKNKKNLALFGYKILIDLILSSREPLKIKEVKINFNNRNRGFSKMRLKILAQLIFFLLIKYFKHEKNKK